MQADQASKRFHLVQPLALALCAAAVAGCSSTPKPPPEPIPVTVNVQASDKINPDTNGRPSPLRVVYYELKSSVVFETADFFALSQNDQGTLGGDLLAKQDFFLRPGDSKVLQRKVPADATVLCAYVEFRDISNSIWRACTPVPTPQKPGMFSFFQSKKDPAVQVQIDKQSVKLGPVPDQSTSAVPAASAQPSAVASASIPAGSPTQH